MQINCAQIVGKPPEEGSHWEEVSVISVNDFDENQSRVIYEESVATQNFAAAIVTLADWKISLPVPPDLRYSQIRPIDNFDVRKLGNRNSQASEFLRQNTRPDQNLAKPLYAFPPKN